MLTIGAAAPAFADIIDVGGGTWNHGTAYQFPIFKKVWSHYVRPTALHSATAIGGSNNVKVYANARDWASADTQCGVTESTATYWSTY